jgi:hypothetical protein
MDNFKLAPLMAPSGEVVVYEYGCRLDPECIQAVAHQISMARRLYNDIIAIERTAVDEAQAYVLDRAGPTAQQVQADIAVLSDQFSAAKARDDEPEMKRIAELRRERWKALGDMLKDARRDCRADVQAQFLSRIGRNSSCATYQARSKAVADGLGWGTAGAVLDASLTAFKKSLAKGRAPRFASGAAVDQDCLTLQFTAAGGVSSADILMGKQADFAILPTNGCGKRAYGDFRFRLGAAKAGTNATGTWQYHRPLPEGSSIALARLVRRRVGPHFKWAIQLLVKPAVPVRVPVETERKALVTVHFGWAADTAGRRVAGIADSADPGSARVLALPPDIESDLERSASIQGERDVARNDIALKVHAMDTPASTTEQLAELMEKVRRTRPQDISANRLHYLCRLLHEVSALPNWLDAWRQVDKMKWQAQTSIARRARNTRRTFYRNVAINLGRQYAAIALEPLDLAEIAVRVNEVTGEKSAFSRRVRSGRVVAALYELESGIRWAATKTGAALLELAGPTASQCGICGGPVVAPDDNHQELVCQDCGAVLDRLHEAKRYGVLVDYRGILKALDTAVKAYQDLEARTQGGYELADIEGLYRQMSSEYRRLPDLHEALWTIFAEVKNRRDPEQYRQVLMPKYAEDEAGQSFDTRQKLRDDFYAALTAFGLCLQTALSSRSFYEDHAFSEEKLAAYKEDLRFFTSLRQITRRDALETVDYSVYEEQIRRMVDKQVIGQQIREPEGVYVVHKLGQDDPENWSTEKTRNETDMIRTRLKKTIEQDLAADPYAQKVFAELLKEAIAEAEAMFDHPLKQYALFRKFEEEVKKGDVAGIPDAFAGNAHARAFFGICRLVLGEENFAFTDQDNLVVEAKAIDQVVRNAVAEHSLNPQNIEAAIRQALLPRLFIIMGLARAKSAIDQVIQVTRLGLSRGTL